MKMRRGPLLGTVKDGTERLALRRRLDRQRVSRALRQRLDEKIRAYDREAAKLEVRGQGDAAQVLRKAADKLRIITLKSDPETTGG